MFALRSFECVVTLEPRTTRHSTPAAVAKQRYPVNVVTLPPRPRCRRSNHVCVVTETTGVGDHEVVKEAAQVSELPDASGRTFLTALLDPVNADTATPEEMKLPEAFARTVPEQLPGESKLLEVSMTSNNVERTASSSLSHRQSPTRSLLVHQTRFFQIRPPSPGPAPRASTVFPGPPDPRLS